MAAQTTATLTAEMMTYYERRFLDRAKYAFRYDQGAQKRTQSQGNGKVLRFTRFTPLSISETPLTEGVNPTEVNLSEANVDVTLQEFGTSVRLSKFLSLTSIDRNNAEKIDVVGQNMGETLDQLVRTALFTDATVQFAGTGNAAIADIAAADVLNTTEIRKGVRTLKANKAMPYEDGSFLLKANPYTTFDLQADSTWVNVHSYSAPENIFTGEIGKIFGVRVIESNNPKTEASTVTVYSNFLHGANAFGTYDLEGDMPKMYIKIPGPNSTDNPADRYSFVSWAGSHAAKVLNASWVLNIKSAAS